MPNPWESVARAVTARRHELGLTQTMAAVDSGVSATTWQKLEVRHQPPSERSLSKMARTLGWPATFAAVIQRGDEPVPTTATTSDLESPLMDADPEGHTLRRLAERLGEVEDRLDYWDSLDVERSLLEVELAIRRILDSLDGLHVNGFEAPKVASLGLRRAREAIQRLPADERAALLAELGQDDRSKPA